MSVAVTAQLKLWSLKNVLGLMTAEEITGGVFSMTTFAAAESVPPKASVTVTVHVMVS